MAYARLLLLTLLFVSCRKLISISPPANEVPTSEVYDSDVQTDASVADLYYSFSTNSSSLPLSVINGMTADEGTTIYDNYLHYVNNSIPVDDGLNNAIWRSYYQTIYRCNAVLEGLEHSKQLTAAKVVQWRGEALFVRALCYYYLVSCWGDVPLIMTTDVKTTSLAYRTPVAQIYTQLHEDLVVAGSALPAAYPGAERVRANKWAAVALAARVSLQQADYAGAEANATSVINAGVYTLGAYDSTFRYNSRDAILQIWNGDGITQQGQLFIPLDNTPYFPLTGDMMASFENGDLRKAAWTRPFVYGNETLYYPYKYKRRIITTGDDKEYLMVLRLAEQYLNRAEARAQLGNYAGATEDLNTIRHKAGLPDLEPVTNKQYCLQQVIHERRTELFTEWGDRWLTLKRAGITDEVLGVLKPGNWTSKAVLYPIPKQERDKDRNLTQNEGY